MAVTYYFESPCSTSCFTYGDFPAGDLQTWACVKRIENIGWWGLLHYLQSFACDFCHDNKNRKLVVQHKYRGNNHYTPRSGVVTDITNKWTVRLDLCTTFLSSLRCQGWFYAWDLKFLQVLLQVF